MFFLRKSNLERLPVSMSGVRMGERVLQIGIDDPALVGSIASKAGLSGNAAIVVADESAATRARAAAAEAGVLVDLQVTSPQTMPFEAASFDVAVLHGMRTAGWFNDDTSRVATLREVYRVLRDGGRVVVIGPGPGAGIGGLFQSRAPETDVVGPLTTAGFRAARVLAAREGYTFTEGMKG